MVRCLSKLTEKPSFKLFFFITMGKNQPDENNYCFLTADLLGYMFVPEISIRYWICSSTCTSVMPMSQILDNRANKWNHFFLASHKSVTIVMNTKVNTWKRRKLCKTIQLMLRTGGFCLSFLFIHFLLWPTCCTLSTSC